MRRSDFLLSLTAPLGCAVVVGLWLGQISLAIAQTYDPEGCTPYQSHPKWGWFTDPSTLTASVREDLPSERPAALGNHSDPTSVQHPDWDSVSSPESWNTPNETAEDSPSPTESSPVAVAGEESKEKSSVCLSESSEPTLLEQFDSSFDLQGEVQSMEEYFQRYGRIYAGSERNDLIESQTTSSEESSDHLGAAAIETQDELPDAQNESGKISSETSTAPSHSSAKKSDEENHEDQKEDEAEEKADWEALEELESSEAAEEAGNPEANTIPVEKEDISSDQSEAGNSENNGMGRHPSEEWEDIPQQEGAQEDLPQEQAGPATSPADQSRGDAPGAQDSSSEAFSPWGYEPGYERVEAEYTPPSEPGNPSQPEQNMSPSEENTSTSEDLGEQKHLAAPDDSPPHRYEYPEGQEQEGEESHSSATRPLDQSEADPSHEDSYPRNEEAPVGTNSSEQDTRQQPNEYEASWSDIPGQEPNTPNPPVNQPEISQYEWWLETPDTRSESTSPQPPDASDLPTDPGQSNASSTDNNLEGEDLKGWKPSDGEWDSIPSGGDVIENNLDASAGLESQAASETGTSLSPAAEDSSSGHPSLLEGLGRSLLRLLEPWRKTVSDLLDISRAAEGVTKTFPTGEETVPQEGAASLPAETMAR